MVHHIQIQSPPVYYHQYEDVYYIRAPREMDTYVHKNGQINIEIDA